MLFKSSIENRQMLYDLTYMCKLETTKVELKEAESRVVVAGEVSNVERVQTFSYEARKF